MQAEPTKEQIAEMAARGWGWHDHYEEFYPPGMLDWVSIIRGNGGWCANLNGQVSPVTTLFEAADWARDELRRVVAQSPIFRDPNAPRWERRDSLWALVVGVDTVVVMADKSRSGQCFLGRAYYLGPAWDSFATTKDLAAELARRGLPPLPEGAWEVKDG